MRLKSLQILDPKRESETQTGRASWYPYYAGFSEKFAQTLIESADLPIDAKINDPWNGSGTTTAAAAGLGYHAYGYDLNPVMVIAARARMLSKREKTSLAPIGCMLIKTAKVSLDPEEPLATWFAPRSAGALRGIEHAIQRLLVANGNPACFLNLARIQKMSDLAAFFYVALFRTTRNLLEQFGASNPTWIKKPTSLFTRLRPSPEDIRSAFLNQVKIMANAMNDDPLAKDSEVHISVGASDNIRLPEKSVDFVLSSPPYCTRIDYAVATQSELAVLGYHVDTEFDNLRRELLGSATVPSQAPAELKTWGRTCGNFLDRLESHPSKASSGYYLKNHLQYFAGMYRSLGEISRTLKKNGACVLVVQDSYYKEIHNDVPRIIAEMAENQSLMLKHEKPFQHQRTMAGINPEVRKYRSKVDAVESVLCFSKN